MVSILCLSARLERELRLAEFNVHGMDELLNAFFEIENVPDEVTQGMLTEGGSILRDEVEKSGRKMGIYDPESSVHILENIKLGKPVTGSNGGKIDVKFSGSRKNGNGKSRKNSTIAFFNEFGARSQSPRPFVRVAVETNSDKIADATGKPFYNWLENTFEG